MNRRDGLPRSPIDEIYRCKAKAKSTFEQCRRAAIPGGRVCVKHGGGAPQVREAAEARIQALVDPAINRISYLIDEGESDQVRLAAAKDALDRAGFKPGDTLKLGNDPENPLQILIAQVNDRA